MATDEATFDWSELAFSSKRPIKDLDAVFIAAPRAMSSKRLAQLVKQYLPKSNILLGLAKEAYVLGLEEQAQFTMLEPAAVKPIVAKVDRAASQHKLYSLRYFQRDLKHILEKVPFRQIVLVNGSWYQSFHHKPEFYILANRHTPYIMVSPFADEQEALDYAQQYQPPAPVIPTRPLSEKEMFTLATAAAKQSFSSADFQTGVALGRQAGAAYTPLATAFNRVVPFQTYAWHYGSVREQHFSPAHDLNYYDTNHAEVEFILQAQRTCLELTDTTLFINLLPCPTCARMLCDTPIKEFIYLHDHSEGYAYELLQRAGKLVRRAAF